MHRPTGFTLRVGFILVATLASAGCLGENPVSASLSAKRFFAAPLQQPDPDITGSTSKTASANVSLRPPPSAVEIRAQCWVHYEQINATLDTKTALTQQCINERLRNAPAN